MKKDNKSYIYQIKNLVNDKVYIGSTCNIKSRWYQHKRQLDNKTHTNAHLQNAWNKYGSINFEMSILEETDIENQYILEQEYLNKLNSFSPIGYNIERLTFKGAKSPHVLIVDCADCGCEFKTYNSKAKICDDCREYEKDYYFNGDWEADQIANRLFDEDMAEIYGSAEAFWDSVI